jgi:DnaJ-class molecular chaperone
MLLALASILFAQYAVVAQMQFEIPAEMLGGLFGGGGGMRMQQQQQQPKRTTWPKSVKNNIAPEFDWLYNTQWQGKTSKYSLLRDGIIESSLKECKREDACLWAANNGKLIFNTPTLGVIEFSAEGSKAFQGDAGASHSLQEHVEAELTKVSFVAVKPNRSGKRTTLTFAKVISDENEDSMIAGDLYKLLGIDENTETRKIKSVYRRKSIQVHPDKCSVADKERCQKEFDQLRQAFEILSDEDKARYYKVGGIALVRNIENSWREVEGQQAQQMAQLDQQLQQVPHHHPQRAQFEAQVNAQKRQLERQLDKRRLKGEIEGKMKSAEIEVDVPLTLEQLYHGQSSHQFQHNKMVMCRGCRSEPTADHCKDCGRCPPEKRQEPKYANTIFGRQVVGTKDREVESKERCRHETMLVQGIRVKRGAQPGDELGHVDDLGHQTPGRLPGRVKLKLAVAGHDQYLMANDNLYTVLTISLQEAIYGFKKTWTHLDGRSSITIARKSAQPGDVLKVVKKGMFNPKSATPYGDLFIRINVELPKVASGTSLSVGVGPSGNSEPNLNRDSEVELRDGAVIYRRWLEAEDSKTVSPDGMHAKDEL